MACANRPVFRFAPSPNGRLHLGHAFSALLNAAFAEREGGRLLLRIEDIDPGRSRPAFERAIHEDLAWLGLTFATPVRRQSEHLAFYRERLSGLRARNLVYPCFCSRSEVARASMEGGGACDPDGAPLYPGTCRHLSPGQAAVRLAAGEPHAWRLDIGAALAAAPTGLSFERFASDGEMAGVAAEPGRWGDAVVARKDTGTSYHLAVVLDDAMQGVTHVVRGADLLAATDLHVLLQELLHLPHPRYHHHPLIRGRDGEKLAKSRGSISLAALREEGASPEAVRGSLGFP